MEDIGSIIGIISGLIGIFTFTTGINSIIELRRLKQTPTPAATRQSKRVARRLWLILPLFGISIVVTAASGLSGSDTAGILSLLLIISLLAVLGFQWFGISRFFPVAAYGLMTAIALTGLGLLFGTISRGEEGFGLVAGMIIGIGSWVIIALTGRRPREPISDPVRKESSREGSTATTPIDQERTVLEIAAQQQGQVRVTDIALKSNLSLDAATQTLKGLAQRGYCRRETLPSGATVYRFPDLEGA